MPERVTVDAPPAAEGAATVSASALALHQVVDRHRLLDRDAFGIDAHIKQFMLPCRTRSPR
jgi:hypothetical protein